MANVRSLFHLTERRWHRSVRVDASRTVMISCAYKFRTKLAQSSGSENTGPSRQLLTPLAPRPVLSPARITLENNGKIRTQPDRENAFAGASGGEKGPDFQPSLRWPIVRKARKCRLTAVPHRIRRNSAHTDIHQLRSKMLPLGSGPSELDPCKQRNALADQGFRVSTVPNILAASSNEHLREPRSCMRPSTRLNRIRGIDFGCLPPPQTPLIGEDSSDFMV
jgi:hypothetical protein